MRIFLVLTISLLSLNTWARSSNDVLTCGPKMRMNKDCHLSKSKLKIHVWQDKIFVNNGVRRSQTDLPAAGPEIEWAAVELLSMGSRIFIQIKYWAAPQELADVSQKIWLVYELNGDEARATQLWADPIQRRKKIHRDPPKKDRYDLDKEIPNKIYIKKKNILYKKLDRDETLISKEIPK